MNIQFTMNCDNPAFCDIPELEAARILESLAVQICKNGLKPIQKYVLLDWDGYNVGEANVME